MTIASLPSAPLVTDPPSTFNTKAFAMVGALPTLVAEINAAIALNNITAAAEVHALALKATPVDADELPLLDSAATFALKRLTWANLKATLAAWINGGTLAGSFTTLATSGNVTLGDATTDTLNVGANGLVKDASGNVGMGRSPSYSLDVYKTGATNTTIVAANDTVVAGLQVSGTAQANVGTLTNHPVVFIQGNAESARIDTSKNLVVTTAALLGYGAGSGGTATQPTSKSTAVPLNKSCGKITMHNASLASGAAVIFTFNNSMIGAGDTCDVQLDSSGIADTSNYNLWASSGTGAAVIALKNISGGALAEAVGIRFSVNKVAQS